MYLSLINDGGTVMLNFRKNITASETQPKLDNSARAEILTFTHQSTTVFLTLPLCFHFTMDYIQQNLQTDFLNKLDPALQDFPLHQFKNPVLCVKAFIQEGDSLCDDTSTYEANRRYPRVELLVSVSSEGTRREFLANRLEASNYYLFWDNIVL
jgi:hypothetical protein